MNFKLYRSDMVEEASRVQRGCNPILETLLFIVIFFICQVALGVLIGIPIAGYSMYLGVMEAAGGAAADPSVLLEKINRITLVLMLYGELFCIFINLGLCRWLQKRKAWTLGFKKRNWLKEYGIGMAAGLAMMTAVVLPAWAIGALKLSVDPALGTLDSSLMLLVLFIGFLFQGMCEEVLCRGYFLNSLARRKGNMWMAIVVSAIVFAALHLANPGMTPLSFLNLTLFGVFAGIYFVKRGDLWGIGALHSLWNFAQGNIWGVAVSGNDFGASVFRCQVSENMTLLNGGSFGLEGGLLVTILLIVCSLILLRLPQKDAAPAAAAASPALSADADLHAVPEAEPAQPQEISMAEESSDAGETGGDPGEVDV